ncbi:ABC transporter ATP-binding protein [Aminipila terrae]|uniref:ABC transporter ATP-binding protein n=1 Tax=Aminipila terrae TaxID=2697030 RepID=UPI002ED44102
MENTIVSIKNVSMKFNLASEKTDSFKEYLVKRIKGKLNYNEFYAINDVSLNVKKGESLGILGANGSGKSTLLKCISGIYSPTCGKIEVNGTIAPLIELGAGFDPELTARENIFLNGAVMGYSKNFMQQKYEEIVEFSELEKFIDVPIKNFHQEWAPDWGFLLQHL